MDTKIDDMFNVETEGFLDSIEKLATDIATREEECAVLDAKLKKDKAEIEKMKEDLSNLMSQNGMESVKLSNGLSPRVKSTTKYYKQAGITDEELFPFLVTNGMDGIIKPTVHFGTLQTALREYLAQGNHLPDNLFNEVTTNSVTMYGKAKFYREHLMKG